MKWNVPTPTGLSIFERMLLELLKRALRNGLTIADNLHAALVDESELESGVERVIQTPGAVRPNPIGFMAIYCEDEAGEAQDITSVRLNKRPVGGDGNVRSGFVGLTVSFGPNTPARVVGILWGG